LAYEKKRSYDRAIADFNEAIRLNPNDAISFCRRGRAKKINEQSGDADIARARQLDAAAMPMKHPTRALLSLLQGACST
jgi:tetratricopeptide (TPR) repeat protein